MMGPDMETLSSFVVAAQHGDLEAFGCIVGRFQAMARAMTEGPAISYAALLCGRSLYGRSGRVYKG